MGVDKIAMFTGFFSREIKCTDKWGQFQCRFGRMRFEIGENTLSINEFLLLAFRKVIEAMYLYRTFLAVFGMLSIIGSPDVYIVAAFD